jgi:hypothetical protein
MPEAQGSSETQPAPNVRYIRHDRQSVAASDVDSKFVIQSQQRDEDEAEEQLKFFSRVRVTRQS